ncbi:HRDC domain-containing protein [Actinomycetaceae bacterium MB13-C1-2]|nr:HRDC domain-containing protein [Actinomycetaceae bacterium MB13-C1-2]
MGESPLFLAPNDPEPEALATRRVRKRRRSAETAMSNADSPSTPLAGPDEVTDELPLLVEPAEGVPSLIDTFADLEQAAGKLSGSSEPVAVDTERAQGRTYGSAAYLVQIRRGDVGTFLIDSHLLPDLSVLSRTLDAEWILHAADQDLACMQDLGLRPSSIFDTEIAARLLGSQHFGLGALTEEYLGIRLKKNHQNEDWSTRPLPKDWLAYAALDVELLPQLREVLTSRLEESDRWAWAEQEFDYELRAPLAPKPNHWRNLKGIGKLRRPEELAVARELWREREEIAKDTDTAPGRVLTPSAIIEASLSRPASKRELLQINDFKRPVARRNIDSWWHAATRAYDLPAGAYPARSAADPYSVPAAGQWKRIDPVAAERLTEVREAVASIAEPLKVAPDVVLSAKVQRALAWWPLNREVPTPEHPSPKRIELKTKAQFIDAAIQRLEQAGARPWQRDLFRSYLDSFNDPLPNVRAASPRPPRVTA